MRSFLRESYQKRHCGSEEIPPPPPLWASLCRIGLYQARKQGVHPDDLEDCALEFTSFLCLKEPAPAQLNETLAFFPAWAHRCAANFAHNYRIKKKRLDEREIAFSQLTDPDSDLEEGDTLDWLLMSGHSPNLTAIHSANNPLSCILQTESSQLVARCIAQLPADQREVLIACVIEGVAVTFVAVRLNRSTGAIYSLLSRARQNMRDALHEELRDDEEEADKNYFTFGDCVTEMPGENC